MITAFHRVAEIALGCLIGAVTAHLVLPGRTRVAIEMGAADALDGMSKVVAAHLIGAGAASVDGLGELVRRHLNAIATAVAKDARERALSLRSGSPTAPLLRTLRRLRSDVAFLERAMVMEPRTVDEAITGSLARHFTEAAGFLRGTTTAATLTRLDAVIGTMPHDGLLVFALASLRRDLGDLEDRLAEQVGDDAGQFRANGLAARIDTHG
jgi:uncharacterized membrane protein YccC